MSMRQVLDYVEKFISTSATPLGLLSNRHESKVSGSQIEVANERTLGIPHFDDLSVPSLGYM